MEEKMEEQKKKQLKKNKLYLNKKHSINNQPKYYLYYILNCLIRKLKQ